MPDALPVVESLAAQIETTYQSLVSDHTLIEFARPKQIMDAGNHPLESLKAQLLQGPFEEIQRQTGAVLKRGSFYIIAPLVPAASSTDAIQKLLNVLGCKIEKVARANPTWSGWAHSECKITGPVPFRDERRIDGVILEIEATIRHSDTDPTVKL